MRNLKKVLALVIAFSMMLSAVAFAGYKDVAADADYAGAVELLSALGIFEGDETGNFNPDKTVTRAEMAAIICRAMGVDVAAQTATKFSDVPASHLASGYIAYASTTDDPVKNPAILDGVGGGKFNPSGTLTYQQALKMIVYALGFEPMAKDNGGWSAGSIYVANRYNITEGADTSATRGNLAIILANAMSTPMMDKTSYGSDAKSEVLNGRDGKEYRTLLTDMDIYVATGMVKGKTANEIDFDIIEDSDDGAFVLPIVDGVKAEKDEITLQIGDSNIAGYKYNYVEAYAKKIGKSKYEVVAVVPYAASETLTIVSDDIKAYADGKLVYYVDAANSSKTKKIEVASGIDVDYNNDEGAGEWEIADFEGYEDAILTLIEHPKTGNYCQVVAKEYTSCRVEDVDADNDKLFLEEGTIKFDFDAVEDGDVTRILVDDEGNALTLADFAKDDVVAFIANGKLNDENTPYIEIVKLSNSAVTGKVESQYDEGTKSYVVIDGQDYEDTTGELDATSEGTFYIGMTGKIIAHEATTGVDNYGYIVEGAISKGSFSSDKWQIKILTKEDGVVTYDIKDNYHDYVVDYLVANKDVFGVDIALVEDDEETEKDESLSGKTDITATTTVDESKAYTFTADKFLWENAAGKDDVARLITFETDSKGEIKKLAAAAGEKKSFEKDYNADAQAIGNYSIENDAVIFVVGEDDIDDIKATDISFLVDDAEYTGYAFRNDESEYAAVVITVAAPDFNAEMGFAVVTQVATATDEEGDKVTKVTYVQNEEEGVLTFGDDSDVKAGTTDRALKMGDAFMYTADANGLVDMYVIIAEIDADTGNFNVLVDLTEVDEEPNFAADLGKDTQIVKGYIYNAKGEKKNGKEIIYTSASIEVDAKTGNDKVVLGDTYTVLSSSYKYTYNTTGTKKKITSGDYTDDIEYRADTTEEVTVGEGEDAKKVTKITGCKVTPVLFRIVDGKVVDIYTSTEVQSGTFVEE